ncbi:hypothetical protein QAD02_012721 [Eretmocerus hayati]|uniref:Uncharacterized protein n=1 Tax=Eretmocerus hayati TaxID=131215 RepID=A0ACC2P0T4_9HYME|nr:hypothetical protein QAD02_012721 [Eretmocerus hayati]
MGSVRRGNSSDIAQPHVVQEATGDEDHRDSRNSEQARSWQHERSSRGSGMDLEDRSVGRSFTPPLPSLSDLSSEQENCGEITLELRQFMKDREFRENGKIGYRLGDIPLSEFFCKLFSPITPENEIERNVLEHMLRINMRFQMGIDGSLARPISRMNQQEMAAAMMIEGPPIHDASLPPSPILGSTRRPLEASLEVNTNTRGTVSGEYEKNTLRLVSSLDKSIQDFSNSLKTNAPNKMNIKRDYNLTREDQFNTWYDCLVPELKSRDLLDIIDLKMNIITEKFLKYRNQSK